MFLTLFIASLLLVDEDPHFFEVRQVTQELVYLAIEGQVLPGEGDRLTISRGGTVTATLEVVSRSSRYISCKVISANSPVAVGDKAAFKQPTAPAEVVDTVIAKEDTAPVPIDRSIKDRPSKPRRGPLRGTVALQFHQYEASGSGSGYTQPTLRLNIRAEDLADGLVGFQLRTRSRYYQSSNTSGASNTDWNNRIYKASVRIGREESRFQYEVGRLISSTFSGVGYLDGGTARMRLGSSSHVGIFAGTQPDWQQLEGQDSIRKYGAFFNFTRGKGDHYLNSTVALAGEYQSGEINREFVYLNNRYTRSKFSLYQSAEVDMNRGWRSERAGQSVSLSNLYLQGSYRYNERLNYSLGYDNRQSYYTWDLRNNDEAYFDRLTRQGWRASVSAKLFQHLRLNAGGGLNSREGETDTRTWYVNLYQPELFPGGWSLRGRVNGFSNPFTEGLSPSLQLGKRWRAGHQVLVGYSTYNYDYLQTAEQRKNGYLHLEGYLNLGKRWFLSGQYEVNSGDDADGQHLYLDLGLRL